METLLSQIEDLSRAKGIDPQIVVDAVKDAIVVAPATADFIAKLVHGLADDLLSTLCLARECPLLVAPAMNRQMWENAATRRNLAQLAKDGVTVIGPASGNQACGEVGMGRMVVRHSAPARVANQRVSRSTSSTLVTRSPGHERVRY